MDAIYLTREFRHKPERVYQALTEPDLVLKWFGPPGMKTIAANINLNQGGKYVFHLQHDNGQPGFNLEGVYLQINPPKLLSFTVNYSDVDLSKIGESVVTIKLSAIEKGGTLLSFKQQFLVTPPNLENRTEAWVLMFEKVETVLQ